MEVLRKQKTKKQREQDTIFNLYKLLHILLMTACITAVWYLYFADEIVSPYFGRGNYVICAGFAVVYFIIVRVYGGFQFNLSKPSELMYSQFFALLFSDCVFYLFICFLSRRFINGMSLIPAFAVQFLMAIVWSHFAAILYKRFTPVRKTVILYGNRSALQAISGVYHLEHKFKVTDKIELDDTHEFDPQDIIDADAVFICGVGSSVRNDIVKVCIEYDIEAYVRPCIGDLLIANSRKMHMFNVPILYCSRSHPQQMYLICKRCIDIFCALVALVILGPFMLLTALCIKCYDGGAVLYKQRRLTKNGKVFEILKFRSMRVDAESDGIARLASEKDNRITPIGKFIRMIRFDELPQIFNILAGQMSVVGPRPERPEIAAQYEQEIPEFSLRLQVKAGLTGYAQIYGKYNTTPYDKLQMDLIYIAGQSIVEDLRLILMTVKVLFMPESTEGVGEGTTTAI
ncbi:MAG: exopolysaccharide biosynthesis polyprenyl glycosylphosphotransferase [Ruthenibacterium sp.]